MFKYVAMGLAVVSFGLLGATQAQAGCGCGSRSVATTSGTAPVQGGVAQAPGVRSTRSYSYEPSYRVYRAPMMRGYGSGQPSWRADRKALGR